MNAQAATGGEPSQQELADQAQPLTEKSTLDVPLSAIPLPPEELRKDLDNSGASDAKEEGPELEVATLDFCGDELPVKTIPLKFHFRWAGRVFESITVTALDAMQMAKVYAEARRDKTGKDRLPDYYDFYAAMCGLPPSVLRALKAADNDAVTDVCWDFLPPSVLPATD